MAKKKEDRYEKIFNSICEEFGFDYKQKVEFSVFLMAYGMSIIWGVPEGFEIKGKLADWLAEKICPHIPLKTVKVASDKLVERISKGRGGK